MLVLGDTRWVKEEYKNLFKANTSFIGGEAMRKAVDEGRADYTPVFLSEILLIQRRPLALDAALVNVSPPDESGYCSLGILLWILLCRQLDSKRLSKQINPQVPRTATYIHISEQSHWY